MPVERLRHSPYFDRVYDFEVEELHCYAAGRNSVLVHNNNGPEGTVNPPRPGGTCPGGMMSQLQGQLAQMSRQGVPPAQIAAAWQTGVAQINAISLASGGHLANSRTNR
jgi:hypothetical protein